MILVVMFLQSCMVMINENDYRMLQETDKSMFKPYSAVSESGSGNTGDLFLYEINTPQMLQRMKYNHYTWIHLWRPYCTSDYCTHIDYFFNLAGKYTLKGLDLLFISECYGVRNIKQKLADTASHHTFYVLEDKYYGHKLNPARQKFMKDLGIEITKQNKWGYDDYIFKDTTLIFKGDHIGETTIDSLISLYH